MYATVQKWGNSNGIRIPKAFLEALGIRENDQVELLQESDSITIKKAAKVSHKTLEQRLTAYYGKPIEQIERIPTEEVDWGKAEGHEVW
jgi:antitoxin MazE